MFEAQLVCKNQSGTYMELSIVEILSYEISKGKIFFSIRKNDTIYNLEVSDTDIGFYDKLRITIYKELQEEICIQIV